MDFRVKTKIDSIDINLDHSCPVVMIGSCFSDELYPHFVQNGFDVMSNPFGTLFHPLAISNVIENVINESQDVDVYSNSEVYFAWEAGGKIFGYSESKLIENVLNIRKKLKNQLLRENVILILTFGSAWAYVHNELNAVVGNCHKAKQDVFTKELTESSDMIEKYKALLSRLKKLNPTLKIILTVSPVRHKKDGLVENNRSKSRLIELVHDLTREDIFYFPSYELVLDELRDYRFYASDLVHPSKDALNYVWDRLTASICNEESLKLMRKVESIKKGFAHKSLYPDTHADRIRLEQLNEQKEQLERSHPEICW